MNGKLRGQKDQKHESSDHRAMEQMQRIPPRSEDLEK